MPRKPPAGRPAARRTLMLMAWLALLGFRCTHQAPPNFIVILVDTLRADYLGCYGFRGPISPNVDELAQECYLFRRCYSSAPWTKPSVASLFTSLNPISHGVTNHEGGMWGGETPDLQKGILGEDALTLAERLQARGYSTAAFVGNPWLTWQYGFDQGFDVYSSVVEPPADRVALEAERWLASPGAREPYFLYVHLLDPHSPYNAPDSTYEKVRGSPSIQTDEILSQSDWDTISPSLLQARWARDASGAKRPETRRLDTWRGRYAAGVREFDDRIGPFLQRLHETGELDRAYLLLISDHGEALNDHGSWGHGYTLYEDQIRVPFLLRPPGGLQHTREVDDVVGLIDILPTLMGLAGDTPQDVEGHDLVPLLDGSGPGGSGIVFSGAARTNPLLYAVTANPYKLHVNGAISGLALFDLSRDPLETVDLTSQRPEEVQRLKTYLTGILTATRERSLFQAATPKLSEERLELLRSLGYMN